MGSGASTEHDQPSKAAIDAVRIQMRTEDAMTREEVEAMLESLGEDRTMADAVFSVLDADKDGLLGAKDLALREANQRELNLSRTPGVRYVLACCGGGSRGAATVAFLKQMQEELEVPMSEAFDLFAGTSIGGFIASVLALGGTTDLLEDIFDHTTMSRVLNKSVFDNILGTAQNQPKYDGKGKTEVIREVLSKLGKEGCRMKESPKPLVLLAYNTEEARIEVLRSSSGKRNPLIVQAIDASSAAPTYFPTVAVKDEGTTLYMVDGGVVQNDPSLAALAEARKLWPTDEIRLLTVGTGNFVPRIPGKDSATWGPLGWLQAGLIEMLMDTSVTSYFISNFLGVGKSVMVNTHLNPDGEVELDPQYFTSEEMLEGTIRVNSELDDSSKENIRQLRRLGDYWWREHKHAIKNMFVVSEK